jgi:hypothetical protein
MRGSSSAAPVGVWDRTDKGWLAWVRDRLGGRTQIVRKPVDAGRVPLVGLTGHWSTPQGTWRQR